MLQRTTSALLTLGLGVTILSGCGGTPDAGSELVSQSAAPFSTTPQEPNHEEITATALAFLRPEIVSALVVANVATDVEFVLVNANHFDDCNFRGGSLVVSSNEADAVRSFDPSAISPEAEASAIVAFAHAIHAAQDFYAHTNWVESGGQTLVDSSLGAFPTLEPYTTIPSSGFVVIQGNKPRHASLTRKQHAPYPTDAIVDFKSGHARARGLMSGTVDYEAGNFCPDSLAMTHSELNKDKSTNAGREAQFEAARALAILQTRHEWCRLNELARAAWGDAGPAAFGTWVAADATPPDCASE